MDSANVLTAQNLHQAFQVFNLASSDLCEAYAKLRQQALVLTQELALANGELRRQFEEKEALRELARRQERLAAMGEMAAQLAHQLRAPLATALLYSSQLRERALPDEKRRRFAKKTVDRLHYLERLIEDMPLLVRGTGRTSEPVATEEFAAAGAAMDMKSLERAHIVETLRAVNGSRKLAVQRLGISERSLRYKLQQYRLEGGPV